LNAGKFADLQCLTHRPVIRQGLLQVTMNTQRRNIFLCMLGILIITCGCSDQNEEKDAGQKKQDAGPGGDGDVDADSDTDTDTDSDTDIDTDSDSDSDADADADSGSECNPVDEGGCKWRLMCTNGHIQPWLTMIRKIGSD